MKSDVTMLRMGLQRIRAEWTVLLYEAAFSKLMLALKDGFDPAQLRDEQGRWSDGGADQSVDIAARGREAECEAQYARDTFICNAVRLRSCWERAADRLATCLRGRSIPTLRF